MSKALIPFAARLPVSPLEVPGPVLDLLAGGGSLLVLWVLGTLCAVVLRRRRRRASQRHRRRSTLEDAVQPPHRLAHPKPPWVAEEILRLKALMPAAGCRSVALTFNRLHGHRETIGKTFVADAVRRNGQEILRLRRDLKHRKPRPLPRNVLWGLDLTFLPHRKRPILAILDHGTRAVLFLEEISSRSALSLLRALVITARAYGLPRALRTDNEPGFCSFLFGGALRLLGVRHQRTLPHCPWQNGRVERFFATFKDRMLRRLAELRKQGAEPLEIGHELALFRAWYNHARPHQNLDGRTPAEAWAGVPEQDSQKRRSFQLVNDWEGLLVGYLPR